jgi:hypothetical protein
LKAGLAGGGLAVTGLAATGWAWFRARPAASGFRVLSELEINFVKALVETYFPPGNALGLDADALEVPQALDAHLAAFAPAPQRIARAALALVDTWPRLSLQSTARLQDLPVAERVEVLRGIDESAWFEVRALGEASRILISLFIFERPEALAAIGHVPGCAFGEVPA